MIAPARYSDLERAAWQHGVDDARAHRSDYVRRSYKWETGERSAYMAGRFAYAADKRKHG